MELAKFSVNRSGSIANLLANDVFKIFCESYSGFTSAVMMDHFDGSWIGPIVDYMTELLIQYAEEADLENLDDQQAY